MNKERLLHLVKLLRESSYPEDFTMDRFLSNCGTPGCVLGHLVVDGSSPLSINFGSLTWNGKYISPYCNEVLEYFGIDERNAYDLFSTKGCGNAQTVTEAADFIEEFVNMCE